MFLDNVLLGFSVLLSPENLLFCLLGCFLGTVIGVLPGIGIVGTLSILLPYTYSMGPTTSIIMMAGIYYGAQYGGSTSSILLNTPGEPSSVVTCIDGYPMTLQGRASQAIIAAGVSSFIAGVITLLLVAIGAPYLSEAAFKFGPKEFSLLMFLGLITISVFSNRSVLFSFGMGMIGILLGTVGTDVNSGMTRFVGTNVHLTDGIHVGIIAIGIFGLAELVSNYFKKDNTLPINSLTIDFKFSDFKKILPSALRGTTVGSIFGLLPGGGAVMSSYMAYNLEKTVSKNKKEFGKGAIEGVAAPEAANNAGSQIGLIPLLTLGIPENAVFSLILSSLIVSGIQPGPQTISTNPELFWGLMVSMLIGNFFLLLLNIPMVKVWLKLMRTPKNILYPILIAASLVGVYFINRSMFDVGLCLFFGAVGLIFIKLDLPPTPLIFGFVVGSMFEENFRRAMMIARGDLTVFFDGTISSILSLAILSIVGLSLYKLRK